MGGRCLSMDAREILEETMKKEYMRGREETLSNLINGFKALPMEKTLTVGRILMLLQSVTIGGGDES